MGLKGRRVWFVFPSKVVRNHVRKLSALSTAAMPIFLLPLIFCAKNNMPALRLLFTETLGGLDAAVLLTP